MDLDLDLDMDLDLDLDLDLRLARTSLRLVLGPASKNPKLKIYRFQG